jgi:hypothetical protein
MAIELPHSLVFQDKKTEEAFLEGENSNLNRELFELFEIAIEGYEYTEPLHVMNEAWYIAKWTFIQKEPNILHFERKLKQYIQKETDYIDSFELRIACLMAFYILKRQKTLPMKISEFLPKMEKICLPNLKNIVDSNQHDNKLYNYLNQKHNDGYNTNLYLEVEGTILYNDIEKATNHFYMEDIKKILPYYGNINEQLKFANCVENYSNHRILSAEDLEIYDYPF